MIALILILTYVISVALVYLWVRLAYYHKDGILSNSEPEYMDIIITFCPMVNTIAVFITWLGNFPIDGRTNLFKPKN